MTRRDWAFALILAAVLIWKVGPAFDYEQASAGSPPVVKHVSSADRLVDGHDVHWWARHSRFNGRQFRQADKDRDARGRTIRRLQHAARRQLTYPTGHWLDGAFLCIHRWERGAAGWQTDTGNGYRGGVQMDWTFSNTYAPDWVIDEFGRSPARWPASVQITVAIHAWVTRGFHPWPNTARRCGLL